jgi:hypothetical protein
MGSGQAVIWTVIVRRWLVLTAAAAVLSRRLTVRTGCRRLLQEFGEAAAYGVDLQLSGHTHGGQVRLPLIGALVTNCSIPTRLARGLSRLGSSYLHVSPGLGTSKYAPFRLFCRPEATLLELRPSAGDAQPASSRSKMAS